MCLLRSSLLANFLPREVTGEGLLSSVSACVRREVVAAAEAAHADAALERLVAGVDAHVARQAHPSAKTSGRIPPPDRGTAARGTGVLPRSVRVISVAAESALSGTLCGLGQFTGGLGPSTGHARVKFLMVVQGSQRWRDSDRLQAHENGFIVLKHCHVVPLAVAGLIKPPIVRNDGEKRSVYRWPWG